MNSDHKVEDELKYKYLGLISISIVKLKMDKQLTINLDEKIYDGLHRIVERNSMSKFIEDLLRPYVIKEDLESAYQEMAQDEKREVEALEWSEAFIGDIDDEAW